VNKKEYSMRLRTMDKSSVDHLVKQIEAKLLEFPHKIGDGDIQISLQITITPNKEDT